MQALSTKKTSDRHIVVTTGDPAGVGPDLCLDILNGNCPATLTIIGDSNVLAARAKLLQVPFDVSDYAADSTAQRMVLHSPATDVIPDNCHQRMRLMYCRNCTLQLTVVSKGTLTPLLQVR
jgi:4-hydroxy-L-threonine phosphate dehydrogenase PdxA